MEELKFGYTWIPCRKGFYKEASRKDIHGIILHSTDGRVGGDISTLSGSTDRVVSVHWYVARSGNIYHFVQDKDIAYHVGSARSVSLGNAGTIGIEQEHFDPDDKYPNGENWPEIQLRSVAKVVAYLKQKFSIDTPILGHKDVCAPAGRKVDPANFPMEKFKGYVREYLTKKMVPFELP